MTRSASLTATTPLPELARRYAGALYDLAAERSQLPMVAEDLTALAAMLKDSIELKTLVANPLVRRGPMAAALEALYEQAKFAALTRQFLHVAVANGRARDLPKILEGFFARLAAERGEVVADVTTARALSPAQRDAVAAVLKTALAAYGVNEVKVNSTVDESLMGGMAVQVGSWMFDGTLKGRLNAMGRQLKA